MPLTIPPSAVIAMAIAGILSFVADYLPFLNTWFNSHSTLWQSRVALLVSIAVGIVLFLTSNPTLGSASIADILSAIGLLLAHVVAAYIASQGTKLAVNDPLQFALGNKSSTN